MELLLKRDVTELGRIGEVVDVKAGYARNYLLPLGIAIPVTKANLEQLEKVRAEAFAEEAGRVQIFKGMASQIGETSITVEGLANEEGHLFGSVTAAQISHALQEKGFRIGEKMISLVTPLKDIGVFDVGVHLHQDVEATIKVWVVQTKPS